MLICFNIFQKNRRTKSTTIFIANSAKKIMIPKISIEHKEKLPNEQNIEHLMENWDYLGLSWNQNDVLGCIIPNNPGKVCPNFL